MSNFIIKWRRRRSDVKISLLELNVFPDTPPGFAAGFFPASELKKSFRWSFKFKQQPLEQNEYPFSATTSSVLFIGLASPYIVDFQKPRKAQRELSQPDYPVTPITSDPGFYPASELKKAFRYKFRYHLQTAENDEYFQPSVEYEYTIGGAWEAEPGKKSRKRRLQRAPDVVSAAPVSPEFYSGYYPGSALLKAFKHKSKRNLQTVELNQYTEKPAPTYTGEFPSFALVKSFRYKVDRDLKTVGLVEYPETPAPTSAESFPAFVCREVRRVKTKRNHKYISEHYYSESGISLPLLAMDVDLTARLDFSITLGE